MSVISISQFHRDKFVEALTAYMDHVDPVGAVVILVQDNDGELEGFPYLWGLDVPAANFAIDNAKLSLITNEMEHE